MVIIITSESFNIYNPFIIKTNQTHDKLIYWIYKINVATIDKLFDILWSRIKWQLCNWYHVKNNTLETYITCAIGTGAWETLFFPIAF